MHLVSKEIENYCREFSSPPDKVFEELVQETYAKTEMPQMQVGHLEGLLLKLLVQTCQAKRVLEIGTFTGYSTLAMAQGLPSDGTVVTCDIDPETNKIAAKHWARSPHGKKIQFKLGDAVKTLQGLQGPFDLAFIDADKENYVRYWELIVPMIRPGGLILVDNVLWSGRVLNPEDETDQAIVDFNRHAVRDKRVESVILSVRDGIRLSRKL